MFAMRPCLICLRYISIVCAVTLKTFAMTALLVRVATFAMFVMLTMFALFVMLAMCANIAKQSLQAFNLPTRTHLGGAEPWPSHGGGNCGCVHWNRLTLGGKHKGNIANINETKKK